jgi:hypothetical protein
MPSNNAFKIFNCLFRILLMAFSTLAVLFIFLSVAGYVAFGPTASWLARAGTQAHETL